LGVGRGRRYLDGLVGPYPADAALYRERSPITHAGRLARPVVFFQGDEDRVVPPNQAEMMADVLRRKGVPVAHVVFAGEGHGFRRAENIRRALDGELYFYSRVPPPSRAPLQQPSTYPTSSPLCTLGRGARRASDAEAAERGAGQVLGFKAADDIEPIPIENLDPPA
jgi:acetyl esterase/lipase